MTSRETAVAARLHEAARRITVDVDEIATARVPPPLPARSRSRRVAVGLAAAAAATAVTAVVVTAVVVAATGDETTEVVPAVNAPVPAPAAAGQVAPDVSSPPDWFGRPQGAHRDSWSRTGRWVSTAIGEVSGDMITAPIVVSVFDGTYEPLDGAETVTVDGSSLRSIRLDGWDGWQAIATDGTPTLMVAGSADDETLRAVLDAVEVIDPSGAFTLRLRHRPDGYDEIVPPRLLARQDLPGRVLASESGHAGIDDASDVGDPLLAAASSGADLVAVDVGGDTGWTGVTPSSPSGPLRFLIWSPRPGVVFEITTDDTDRTEGDLVELALATSPLEVDEWDVLHGD